MDFEVLLPRVALALGIGLLIGLERGWRTRAAESGQPYRRRSDVRDLWFAWRHKWRNCAGSQPGARSALSSR